MAKIAALSGFPEWLPSERLVEQHVIDVFREVAELHGFSGIETRAVEPLEQLLRKGEIDKEVYVLRRLHAEEGDEDAGADRSRTLGLHFDLTVPLARYVLEHQNDLAFPFRRYQIQKVWRGERPQDGRFREFYQADLDVIGQDTLPGHVEAEVAIVMAEILSRLPLPQVSIHANTRRLSEGFFRAIGFEDHTPVLRALDKLPKIGADAVSALLRDEAGASEEQAQKALAFASIRTRDASFAQQVRDLGGSGEMVEEGIAELTAVIERVEAAVPGMIVADLSIARGLDYYTGTVFESFVAGHESLGSICSGGRYDRLASDNRHTYPGVGLSIGLSRLVPPRLGRDGGPEPRGPHLRARLGRRRGAPGPQRRGRPSAARPRHLLRGGPERREVRQADPLRRPPRHPLHLVPRRGGHRRRGQGHSQRRPVRGRRHHLAAPRRGPSPTRPRRPGGPDGLTACSTAGG